MPLLALLAGAAGCGSSATTTSHPDAAALHIGRTCAGTVPPAGDGGAPVAVVDIGLECPSQICALPPQEVTTDTSFLCTADCADDRDCAVAEFRDTSNNADRRCRSGFACLVATTQGDFCCRKLCLCNDFFRAGPPPATPAACAPTPENRASCANIN
jgi:hypothetical protein